MPIQAASLATVIIGRSTELSSVTDTLAAISTSGAALVVDGEAGIGKSTLLSAIADWAVANGYSRLGCSGLQSQSEVGFAGIHELIHPVLDHTPALPPRQRTALLTAFGLAEGPTPDRLMVSLAVLGLLEESASRRRIVLIIDDVQWLDQSSLEVLAFVARRLSNAPLMMLCAERTGLDGATAYLDGLPRLSLGPLAPEHARQLLSTTAQDADALLQQRVLEQAGGNPLAVIELSGALSERGSSATFSGEPLPTTRRVERAFLSQLDDLTDNGRLLAVSSHLTVVVAFDPRVTSAAVLPRAYGAAVAAETRWQVFWCDPKAEWDGLQFDPLLAGLPSIAEVAHRNGNRAGQPFLLRSDGAYATEVNAFFASVRMRGVTEGTRRKYALGLATWLGFLDLVSCCWADATADHVDTFKFWRMSDEKNPRRVAGGTVRSGLVAISAFYEWAESRYHVENPVERISVRVGPDQPPVDAYRAAPRTGRDRDVKWLDPGGYARWRDVGLRGLDLSGREARSWRGHCPQRDCSFVDGLYGTGLRLTEWASLLQIELPYDDPSRGFMTAQLAAACAKGGVRRKYWMPRPVLSAALAYGEGERAAAVRRAQAAGRYERVADRKILQRQLGGRRVQLRDMQGQLSSVSLDVLDPRARLRIFRESKSGLEPVALWLNEDGMPRAPHGWQHTFVAANKRVTRASLIGLAATAHMLRHSFALRWFSVGRLLYEKRFAHLNAEEMRDFRAQFGDTWYFVMTLLGHRSVATTMNVYLEPFRDLDVELLIEHAHGAAMQGLLAEMFATHPLVTTDPLASGSQS